MEIEQGKVYRLVSGGLFVAESRHENPKEPQSNHWLMRRITIGGRWDGYNDPLIFDSDPAREWFVLREATEDDYLDYEDKYLEEQGRLLDEADIYRKFALNLARRRNGNWLS